MAFTRIPPIHCLVTFEALARLRSVAKASEELCVTPSAVSHRVRQLEDHLGVKLFTREFGLTPDGALHLEHVGEGLASLQHLSGRAGPQRRPRLRVAAPPTFCRQVLMPKLATFRALCPDVDLVLHVAIPLADISAERTDLEVRFGLGGYSDRECRLIQEDRLTPACSPAFLSEFGPFSGFQSLTELSHARLIRSPLEPWAPWFKHCGVDLPEPSGSQFNDIGLAYDAAASGFGAMLVRHKLGAAWFDSGRLVRLSEQSVASPYSYHLCWAPGTLERWECAAFADWMANSLA